MHRKAIPPYQRYYLSYTVMATVQPCATQATAKSEHLKEALASFYEDQDAITLIFAADTMN